MQHVHLETIHMNSDRLCVAGSFADWRYQHNVTFRSAEAGIVGHCLSSDGFQLGIRRCHQLQHLWSLCSPALRTHMRGPWPAGLTAEQFAEYVADDNDLCV